MNAELTIGIPQFKIRPSAYVTKVKDGDTLALTERPLGRFSSHAGYLKVGKQCATCHGLVDQQDVLAKEISTSMTLCMNCHPARKTSNDCSLCHQLGH